MTPPAPTLISRSKPLSKHNRAVNPQPDRHKFAMFHIIAHIASYGIIYHTKVYEETFDVKLSKIAQTKQNI